MNRPKALITGASRGIGQACVKEFSKDYEIISLARTGNVTLKGDIGQKEFARSVIETYDIELLINCAGVLSDDYMESLETNVYGPSQLTLGFYKKMYKGHIVNLTSEAALKVGWEGMEPERIYYQVAKHQLKKLSNTLEESRWRNIKITSLELGWVNTSFGDADPIDQESSNYLNQNHEIIPMSPDSVASIIRWIISQPSHMQVHSLCMRNFKFHSL